MLTLAVLTLGMGMAAQADFKVSEIKAEFKKRALMLNGKMDLIVSPKVEEAISKGIPLEIEIDVRLYRQRRFLWAQELDRWTLHRQIRYHALSGQYIVSDKSQTPAISETFTTLQEALHFLGTLSAVELPLSVAPDQEATHRVSVRVALDIGSLPAPLHPVAYTSLTWRLNSGWSTWPVGQ